MKKNLTAETVVLFLSAATLYAGEFSAASSYTLRDLEADRPDATESPRTVDAGHFQIESSILSYSKDRSSGMRSESWSWAETNFKYGLNNSMDLQLVLAPYVRETARGGGAREVAEGFGDVTLRLKWNIWGNDEGKTAFALFPYVKIPSGSAVSNDHWEGGLILPWSTEIRDGIDFGMQAEFAYVWDDDKRDYSIDFLHTAVLGFDVTDRLGLYIEYLGIAGNRGGSPLRGLRQRWRYLGVLGFVPVGRGSCHRHE